MSKLPSIGIQGNIAQPHSTQINNVNVSTSRTIEEIDRDCLRALRCPDSFKVKNRLKETKDKLLYKSIEWIFRDEQYVQWQDGNDIGLLWIRGGAGKGKTMMSIGLIEELVQPDRSAATVLYFFCQNADYELNTVEAIIKGLILQLVNQHEQLRKSLRNRWDVANEKFEEDVTSWRGLWEILMEMLDHCPSQKVYIAVDALDECQGSGMAYLLKQIVRAGLSRPSRLKWLLTSRPLDAAERMLLTGSDQAMVSLELNAEHIANAVQSYIAFKVDELDRSNRYGSNLRNHLRHELTQKAEDTFLWVSLVCKKLEDLHREQALLTVRAIPPGLTSFYNRILSELCQGEESTVNGCTRLLNVLLLVFRPLRIGEAESVTASSRKIDDNIAALVDRCASFIRMRGPYIEFVHQSARDFLGGEVGQTLLKQHDESSHGEIALRCISFLSRSLKVNVAGLPKPDSTPEDVRDSRLLTHLDYAASLWHQHLDAARGSTLITAALNPDGPVKSFFETKLLEWFECLSLLNKLPRAMEALAILKDMRDLGKHLLVTGSSLSMLVQNAMRFLLRHYQILAKWPLQIYISAVVFSPTSCVVRQSSLTKSPDWLRKIPNVERRWTSLVQTLAGHSSRVNAVTFSPDGKRILSGDGNGVLKLWDTTTGDLKKTLPAHTEPITAVAFSPDNSSFASGSFNEAIRIWNATTYELETTLTTSFRNPINRAGDALLVPANPVGDSRLVSSLAFMRSEKVLVSVYKDGIIRLWDSIRGDLLKNVVNKFPSNVTVLSVDGQRIGSQNENGTVVLWDVTTSTCDTLHVSSGKAIDAMAFSPDGNRLLLLNADIAEVWDITTHKLQMSRTWFPLSKCATFSPDGEQVVSGSGAGSVFQWDVNGGDIRKAVRASNGFVVDVAFSPDGSKFASASSDATIKVWDSTIYEVVAEIEERYTSEGRRYYVDHIAGRTMWEHPQTVTDRATTVEMVSDDRQSRLESGNVIPDGQPALGESETQASHSHPVSKVVLSPDGTLILSASMTGDLKIWSVTSGRLLKNLGNHNDVVRVLVFSSDGKTIASGSESTVKTWNVMNSEQQTTIHIDMNVDKDWLPMGWRRAHNSGGALYFVEDSTAHATWISPGLMQPIKSVEFSPDSLTLVTASKEGKLQLWDPKTGRSQRTIRSRCSLVSVAFSPDGKHIVSGASDGTVEFWDVTRGTLVRILVGHLDWVNTVAFSSDGQMIGSASDDKTIRLWNTASLHKARKLFTKPFETRRKVRDCQEIRTEKAVHGLRFVQDGRYLATNIGLLPVDETEPSPATGSGLLLDLRVRGQWICYGPAPVLNFPPDFVAECFDASGDHITVGFHNGRVLSFDIDRELLWSWLNQST